MKKNRLIALAEAKQKEHPKLNYAQCVNLLKATEIKGEVWKPLIYPNAPSAIWYEVSNLGRIRSVRYYVERSNRWDGKYQHLHLGTVLSVRDNGKDAHLYSSIGKSINGKPTSKTVYCHLAVALAFLPRDPKRPKASHRNGNKIDNRPDNLMWVDQSYLSRKQMLEAPPERRNWMGRHNQEKNGVDQEMINKFIMLVEEGGMKVYKAGNAVGLTTGSAYYHWHKYQAEIAQELKYEAKSR